MGEERSEMSMVDSSAQSPVTSGMEDKGSSNRGKIVAVVVLLLLLGIMAGLVATGAFEKGPKPDDKDEDYSGNGSPGDDREPGVYSTRKTPAHTTKRSGMLVCVVQKHLPDEAVLVASLCDYIIFSELTITKNTLTSYHFAGIIDWNMFIQAFKDPGSGAKAGAGFVVPHPKYRRLSLENITAGMKAVEELLKAHLNVRALGFLNLMFHETELKQLKPILKEFSDLLKDTGGGITFLGVYLRYRTSAYTLRNELKDLTFLDVLIMQTHISDLFMALAYTPCEVRYVGYKRHLEHRAVPSLELAMYGLSLIREEGIPLRVLFSSTLGVMTYFSTKVPNNETKCFAFDLTTTDYLCPSNTIFEDWKYDFDEIVQYYNKETSQQFKTAMDENTTEAFINVYLDKLDGWAAFSVEMEKEQNCKFNESFKILRKMSRLARSLKIA